MNSKASSETVHVGNNAVHRLLLPWCGEYVYTAWEASKPAGDHGTITTLGGGWYGQIGTRRNPEVEALRGGSPERCALADRMRAAQCREAHALILQAFPEASRGTPDGSEIRMPTNA